MRIDVVEGCLVRSAGPASGTALWFLHGFSDSGLAFREVLESSLADEFGLYAPDLPGFGASPPRHTIRTIDRFTEATVRLIETLKRYHYPAASKYCMSLIDLPCGQPRQPLLTLTTADEASLRNELEALGFFDWALP